MGLRCPSGLSEHDHEWKSTKPQKVTVCTAVDLLNQRLSPSIRDEFCPLDTQKEGVTVELSKRSQGTGFRMRADQKELVISLNTQQKGEAGVTSYQPYQHQVLIPGNSTLPTFLHSALPGYTDPLQVESSENTFPIARSTLSPVERCSPPSLVNTLYSCLWAQKTQKPRTVSL